MVNNNCGFYKMGPTEQHVSMRLLHESVDYFGKCKKKKKQLSARKSSSPSKKYIPR